ncbi:hypothetical protein ACWEP5_33510 [Nocardia niigatensis]
MTDAAAHFGPIDVLEFSPHAGLVMVEPKDVTIDNLRPQIDQYLFGAVAATQAVLPAMPAAGAGTPLSPRQAARWAGVPAAERI